ncbi:MAG: HAD family phosphatase [Proteobacteria bacterium]|nr:HAD family phosphatase [Pseudomonadota bacterium]
MTTPTFGIIWDMDGTLVDTAEHHHIAWRNAANSAGRNFSQQDFANTFGHRNPEIIKYLFGSAMSEKDGEELSNRKEQEYRDAISKHGVSLLPGARELIEDFHRNGHLQAIGTSAPRANLEQILKQTNISSFFAATVTGQDTQRGKPNPEVFLKAASILNIAPNKCVVFEDAEAGIKAAKAAGMRCVGVCTGGHSSAEDLKSVGADLIVPNLTRINRDIIIGLF